MRVYLAGWDVFLANARAAMAVNEALCREHGIEPLNPLDNDVGEGDDARELRARINAGNLAMIRRSDAVIANLNPFRGFEPDSGTVFECGFACALEIPVFGYIADPRPLVERYQEYDPAAREDQGCIVDGQGRMVEDLGNIHNLMLEENLQIVGGGFGEALACLLAQRREGADRNPEGLLEAPLPSSSEEPSAGANMAGSVEMPQSGPEAASK
jgi:nucleoside 2-deoxyribosyltransferase